MSKVVSPRPSRSDAASSASLDSSAPDSPRAADPRTTFGVAATTMYSVSDCSSDTPTVEIVSACTLRRTSSRLGRPVTAGVATVDP
jgi:hypothetical protein